MSDIHIEPKKELGENENRWRASSPTPYAGVVLSARCRHNTCSFGHCRAQKVPQDGRFKTRFKDNEVEMRLSTAPTAFGEKMVARIFDPGVLLQDIEQLGFFSREQQMFRRMITSNTGLVLVVGPTGSGKTTALYSSLHYLNTPRG